MYLKNYAQETPYIGNKFKVEKSVFLNELTQSFLSSPVSHSATGHNANFNIKHVLKSSIGEWIERKSLGIDLHKEQPIVAFNMLNGEPAIVEHKQIYFYDNDDFIDSCGVASHLNSISAIKSGFMEFFERQSLIFRWITKRPGILIDITDCKNEKINKLITNLYNFIDEVYLIDISVHPSIKTIIVLGSGRYYKGIGLQASENPENAIVGALEEMYQTFGNSWNKNYINEYETFKPHGNLDFYLEYYHSLTPDKFIDEYSFLISNTPSLSISIYLDQASKNFDFNNLVNLVSNDIGIQPICAYIPCFYEGFRTKIIKILSPNSYPHMFPVLFTQEETEINFGRENIEFPNAYKQIPFP
ncbi:Bacteriocin biosynthesis docking scaffold, SagD family [Bacillus cereus]|uniref:Uncharacterized protein n=2 Tax=Bacillus wiedmannii TaxID=1890302 RepID=A0A2B5P3V8_9BACI|nr:YcaO-like family protein [Bacillus wiedmannii]KMP77630.1 hypothetical protein TU62_04150 [Bacillus cereus]MBG9855631.1 hypothetical protein [Bacillus wiedmannii]MCQ6544440.1 YcaO-like family protein [Bacillus wiedmannii]MCQ6573880.1 YcaO-like family protein [Bacillus wiedmannii]MCU5574608.1 YcaO-like family protein [Bacillus wiedmannii]